jgi:hypothetical protein
MIQEKRQAPWLASFTVVILPSAGGFASVFTSLLFSKKDFIPLDLLKIAIKNG